MRQLEFLPASSNRSTDELISFEGKYRIDSLVLAFEEGIQEKYSQCEGQQPNEEELVVLAVEALEREVNNGGYHQFFFNAPEFVSVIVDSLFRVGTTRAAQITQQAIDALEIDSSHLSIETVQDAIGTDNPRLEQELESLDELYYAEIGDLAEPLFEFIKKNKERIDIG